MILRLLGILTLGGCFAVVFLFESQSSATGVLRLLHWPAMVLTGVGPFALCLICYDAKALGRTAKAVFGRTPDSRQEMHEREAVILHKLSNLYFEEGPSAFEKVNPKGISEYATRMIERLAVRMPTADIREFLNVERERAVIRLVQILKVVGLGVRLAPSVGMLGTILGMVSLLSTLSEPSQIGSHMSLALLTTFYGLFFSLVVWTPVQQKLERIMDLELEGYDQVLRWLELLERRKPLNYIEEALVHSGELPRKVA